MYNNHEVYNANAKIYFFLNIQYVFLKKQHCNIKIAMFYPPSQRNSITALLHETEGASIKMRPQCFD